MGASPGRPRRRRCLAADQRPGRAAMRAKRRGGPREPLWKQQCQGMPGRSRITLRSRRVGKPSVVHPAGDARGGPAGTARRQRVACPLFPPPCNTLRDPQSSRDTRMHRPRHPAKASGLSRRPAASTRRAGTLQQLLSKRVRPATDTGPADATGPHAEAARLPSRPEVRRPDGSAGLRISPGSTYRAP